MSDFNLFIYKIFSSSGFDTISFIFNFQKKIIYTYCIKRIYYKISIWQQKLFYLLLQKMNKFLQFYLQKYFNLFSLRKMTYKNYYKKK